MHYILRYSQALFGVSAESNGIADGSDTSHFEFVDGSDEGREFFEAPRELPWAPSQPNEFNDQRNRVLYLICQTKSADVLRFWISCKTRS